MDERPLDPTAARQVGLLAAETGGTDVVDGHVATLTRRPAVRVVTSHSVDLEAWGVAAQAIIPC